jgi:hypothetical protein
MKSFKAIGAAFILALSLSIPAYAEEPKDPSDLHQPGAVNPGGIPSGGTTPINHAGLTLADILSALIRIL